MQLNPMPGKHGTPEGTGSSGTPHEDAAVLRRTRAGTVFSPWLRRAAGWLQAPTEFDLPLLFRKAINRAAADKGANDAFDRAGRGGSSDGSGERSGDEESAIDDNDLDEHTGGNCDGSDRKVCGGGITDGHPHGASAIRARMVALNSENQQHAEYNLDPRVHETANALGSPRAGRPKKHRDKARFTLRRRTQREKAARQAATSAAHQPPKQAARKHARRSMPMHAFNFGAESSDGRIDEQSFSIASLPVSSSAFGGRRSAQKASDKRVLSMQDAMEQGFQRVKWDGRDTITLLDAERRIFASLVGMPNASDWDAVTTEAVSALRRARDELAAPNIPGEHRRGRFTALASGVSFGGGQTEVCNASHTSTEQRAVDALLDNPAIRRIAGFGDAAFNVYAPRLHQYYHETLESILQRDRRLKRNFANSVFASTTFNLGPQTVTYRHTDFQNLAAGWCAITALGNYDHTVGGHLILWDARMIIEFPPGATILIPSALLSHSNTAIQPHEGRYSMTQYSASGLFRWVECGFRSQKSFEAAGNTFDITGPERWQRGLDMFSTWDEICVDAAA